MVQALGQRVSECNMYRQEIDADTSLLEALRLLVLWLALGCGSFSGRDVVLPSSQDKTNLLDISIMF
eukprot:5451227-Amphidinium_carterae.1